MDEKRSVVGKLGGLEGADAAALGIDATPEPAPAGAEIPDDEQLVPGADVDDFPRTEAKPWFTSLAARSDQAGVGNESPDGQEPDIRHEDEIGS